MGADAARITEVFVVVRSAARCVATAVRARVVGADRCNLKSKDVDPKIALN